MELLLKDAVVRDTNIFKMLIHTSKPAIKHQYKSIRLVIYEKRYY